MVLLDREAVCMSNETDCYSLGPVGPKMTMKPDGVLMSGMSYKLHERTSSAPPASGMSGGSETPSLAEIDAANVVAMHAASDAALPEAVARGRARGFQPTTVFENRKPALRMTLANPTEVGRSHDDGGKAFGRGRLMRADNISTGGSAATGNESGLSQVAASPGRGTPVGGMRPNRPIGASESQLLPSCFDIFSDLSEREEAELEGLKQREQLRAVQAKRKELERLRRAESDQYAPASSPAS